MAVNAHVLVDSTTRPRPSLRERPGPCGPGRFGVGQAAGRRAGGSRSIAASRAAAAGSSMRSGSPWSARERRASAAPAARISSRSCSLSGLARGSAAAGGVVWPHLPSGDSGWLSTSASTDAGVARRARARARRGRTDRSRTVAVRRGGRAPGALAGLDRAAGVGQLAQPGVDPRPAHAARAHEHPDREPFSRRGAQRRPQRALWPLSGPGGGRAGVGTAGQRGGRQRRSWCLGRVGPGPAARVLAGLAGDLVIGDQVAASALGRGVLGRGDQERAGLGERVRMPPGRQ